MTAGDLQASFELHNIHINSQKKKEKHQTVELMPWEATVHVRFAKILESSTGDFYPSLPPPGRSTSRHLSDINLKETVHPTMKILSSFTYPHVLTGRLSSGTQTKTFLMKLEISVPPLTVDATTTLTIIKLILMNRAV